MALEETGALDEFSKEFSEQEIPNGDFLSPPAAAQAETDEETEPRKNRHTRRLEAKLQAERESNIQLAAKLEAKSEAEEFMRNVQGLKPSEALLTLYGNDENGKRAAEITQKLLDETADRAKSEALKAFKQEQEAAEKETRQQEQFIDEQLEALEDESGMDLTSNAPLARKNRSEFLTMVERLSPKDEDGNIKEYADFDEVFETFKERQERPSTRQKELASRGMIRSGQSTETLKDSASEQYLKNLGII